MEGRPKKSAFFFIFQFLHTFQNYPLKHTITDAINIGLKV